MTKEEKRQEELVADSRILNTSSVVRDTVFTEATTVAPDVGFFSKFLSEIGLRNLENEDRMIGKINLLFRKEILSTIIRHPFADIYIFSGITVATVIITLSRSFLFFSVSLRALPFFTIPSD